MIYLISGCTKDKLYDEVNALEDKVVSLEEELFNLQDTNEELILQIEEAELSKETLLLLIEEVREEKQALESELLSVNELNSELAIKLEDFQKNNDESYSQPAIHEMVENIVLEDRFSGISYLDSIDDVIDLHGEPITIESYDFGLGDTIEGLIEEYYYHNITVVLYNDDIIEIVIENTGGLDRTKINIGDHYSILEDIFNVEIDLSEIVSSLGQNPSVFETDDENIVRVIFDSNPLFITFFVEHEKITKIKLETRLT